MSQVKMDALQRVYSGWERGDFSVGGELLAPDVFVTWEVPEGWISAHGQQVVQQRMLSPWSRGGSSGSRLRSSSR